MNSSQIYNYIMSQPLPDKWSTPDSLKKSYQRTNNVLNTYKKQIDARLKSLADVKPVTNTAQYQNLLDLYNKQYEQNAAIAAGEAVGASEGMNAGYGDTYSQAATDQAYTSYMADRGAAVPNLMAAAADSVNADRNALAAGINQMQNQRDIRSSALQSLFNSQFSGIQKETTSRQNAYNTMLSGLSNAYSIQKEKEEKAAAEAAARAAAAAAARAARASGGGGGSNRSGSNSNSHQSETEVAWTIYNNAIKHYPALKGTLTPPGHGTGSAVNTSNYGNYVQGKINTLLADNTEKNKKKNQKKNNFGIKKYI